MKKMAGLFLAAAVFLGGCATSSKVNWEARVGTFTYDQAVTEMGPPDKEAKLSDGTRVLEWLTSRAQGGTWVSGYRGGGVLHLNSAPAPEYFLRLTFSPDDKLQAWKKYAK
jgi:hypothetical protein